MKKEQVKNPDLNNFQLSFLKYCQEFEMLEKNDKVLVSYSGGADSTALVHTLSHLKNIYNLDISVLHINYQLRGAESDSDEEFARKFCKNLNLKIDVRKFKLEQKKGIENQTRIIREEIFQEYLKNKKIDKIALGHNKNDQAETMLFRLIRGTGITGIKGILPVNDKKIHPLLKFGRDEIRTYLRSLSLSWVDDSSNSNTIYDRNKIRLELIPWVIQNLNTNVVERLSLSASIFRETDEYFRNIIKSKINRMIISQTKNAICFDIKAVLKMESLLRFYLFRETFRLITDFEKDFYHSHFLEIEKILSSKGSKKITISHSIIIMKSYDELQFSKSLTPKTNFIKKKKVIERYKLETLFDGYRLQMQKVGKDEFDKSNLSQKNIAFFDFDKISFPLTLRYRKDGDKFIPFGMKSSKKIKNFFIDNKVKLELRDKIILLCDANKIMWVTNFRIDQEFAITEETINILKLELIDNNSKPNRNLMRKRKKEVL